MTPISPRSPSAWRGSPALGRPILSTAIVMIVLVILLGPFLLALISADWKANAVAYLQIPRVLLEHTR